MYKIYQVLYHTAAQDYQSSIVSASSPREAQSLLEESISSVKGFELAKVLKLDGFLSTNKGVIYPDFKRRAKVA